MTETAIQKSGAKPKRRPKKDPAVKRAERRTLAEDALNLPNLLTMARVVMIPICLWFLDRGTKESCFWSAAIFTLAAFTDMLDGYLARKLGVVSVLGKFLDPLADKLIVMACLIWMVPMGRIPAWATILLLAREISVTGLRSVAASEGVVISAGQEGKLKTAFQMIGISALLLGVPYHMHYAWIDLGMIDLIHVGRAFVYLSLGFSLFSAVQYVSLFGEAVQAKEKKLKERPSQGELPDEPGE